MTQIFNDDVEVQGNLQVSDDAGSANAMLEVHRDASSSGALKRGLQVTGEVEDASGVTPDSLTWSVQEVTLTSQTGNLTGSASALRTGLLLAGDADLYTGVGVDVRVSKAAGASGNLSEAIGLRITDIDQASNNYAIQTGKGIVHLGDVMQLAEVTATPSAPPTGTVHLYVKGDGKLYAQTADGSEYSLLDSSSSGGSNPSPQTYTQKLQSIETANLIAHWPLAEAAGTTVIDESGNNYAGIYSGVTLGATGIGDGRTAASFVGSSSSIASMHSSGLDMAFDRNEGTLLAWAKVSDASVWTDGADHTVMRIGLDSQDIAISIRLSSNNNELEAFRNANNVSKSWIIGSLSDTGWMCLALTWSTTSDEQKLYINGTQVGATLTGLGDGTGKTLSSRVNIGAFASSGNKRTWEGDLAHVALWKTALSPAQISTLAAI